MKPDLPQFLELSSRGNLIPVYEEHLSDMETPVSVLSRFIDDEYAFLLESVEGGRTWGRYSIIGINPKAIFELKNGTAQLYTASGVSSLSSAHKGFMALREVMQAYKPVEVPGLPRFCGGAVGYTNYEIVHEFEPNLPSPKTNGGRPDALFMISDTLIIFDNVRHTMKIVANARLNESATPEDAYRNACERVAMIRERLRKPVALSSDSLPANSMGSASTDFSIEYQSNCTQAEYEAMVAKAQQHIVAGDIIQVVLSQKFQTKLQSSPLSIYRALRLVNPSPYTFMLKFKDRMLVGASPEVLVRLTNGEAVVRPIAGTRPRGATEQEDRALADELLADPKEKAEHLMLVDLGRNDLGRVAVPGSVRVPDFMVIEKYSHVQHMVSTVTASLKENMDIFSLIQAVFPAGTLSGAPKFRAMELIHELEADCRGFYGGTIGYIGFDGNADLAITIRTMEINHDEVTWQAGAGVVYDSNPQKEYEECLHKAQAMKKALELAGQKLQMEGLV
jgi:anthranilate synthase component I